MNWGKTILVCSRQPVKLIPPATRVEAFPAMSEAALDAAVQAWDALRVLRGLEYLGLSCDGGLIVVGSEREKERERERERERARRRSLGRRAPLGAAPFRGGQARTEREREREREMCLGI